jgi:hypothetical protein
MPDKAVLSAPPGPNVVGPMGGKIQDVAVITRKRLSRSADGIAGGLPEHTRPRSYREEIEDVSACSRASDSNGRICPIVLKNPQINTCGKLSSNNSLPFLPHENHCCARPCAASSNITNKRGSLSFSTQSPLKRPSRSARNWLSRTPAPSQRRSNSAERRQRWCSARR